MSKETIERAGNIILGKAAEEFDDAQARMDLFNEGITVDNPHAIVEELNTHQQWFLEKDELPVKFLVVENQIVFTFPEE